MDHRVGGFGAAREAVEILERPAMDIGAGRRNRRRGRIGPRETEHRVPGSNEFGHDGRADEARRSSNKDTHVQHLRMAGRLTICRSPRTVKS